MKSLRSQFDLSTFFMAVLLFFLLSTWAISSPVGSSPDESTHLTSAWCLKNFKADECTKVPKSIYSAGKCFIYDNEQVATCSSNISGFESPSSVNKPTIYIKFLTFFLGENINTSVLLMRIANAMIISLFFLLLTFITNKKNIYITYYSLLLTSLPLGFYLIPSISTSSWLIILFTILIPLLIKSNNKILNLISFLILVALVFIINDSRPETLVLVVGSILASGIFLIELYFNFPLKNKYKFGIILSLNFLYFILLWNNSELIKFRPEKITFFETVSRFQSLIIGIFGGWGLGSLEVTLPGIVFIFNFIIIIILIFLSISSASIINNLAIILNLILVSVIIIFSLYNSNLRVGEWLQPRYFLPLFYPIIFITIFNLFQFSYANFKIIIKIIMPLQIFVYSFSHFELLKRYTHGADYFHFNLNNGTKWWWEPEIRIISPMAVLVLSIVCFTMLLGLVYHNLFIKNFTQESKNAKNLPRI